ncbi:MAG: cytochrome c [Myxococcota bacterium]|nr:cytochrome c [Myxococcota bacterium]
MITQSLSPLLEKRKLGAFSIILFMLTACEEPSAPELTVQGKDMKEALLSPPDQRAVIPLDQSAPRMIDQHFPDIGPPDLGPTSRWQTGANLRVNEVIELPEESKVIGVSAHGALIEHAGHLQWRSPTGTLPEALYISGFTDFTVTSEHDQGLEDGALSDAGLPVDGGKDLGHGEAESGRWMIDAQGLYLPLPQLPEGMPELDRCLAPLSLSQHPIPLSLVYPNQIWTLHGLDWRRLDELEVQGPLYEVIEGPEGPLIDSRGGIIEWRTAGWSLVPISPLEERAALRVAPWESGDRFAFWRLAAGEVQALFDNALWRHESWRGVAITGSADGLYALSEGETGTWQLSRSDGAAPWKPFTLPSELSAPRAIYGHWAAPGLWIIDEEGRLWRGNHQELSFVEGLAPLTEGARLWVDDRGWVTVADEQRISTVSPGRGLAAVGVDEPFRGTAGGEVLFQPDEPEEIDRFEVALADDPLEALSGPPWRYEIVADREHPGGVYPLRARVTYRDGEIIERRWEITLEAPISWEADIEPIFLTDCARCHDERAGAARVLSSPAEWTAQLDLILDQVRSGAMPIGAPALSGEEVSLIERWRDDGLLETWP